MAWPKGRPRNPKPPTDVGQHAESLVRNEHDAGSTPAISSTPIQPENLWHELKAEDWVLDSPALPWQQPRCRECNRPMWTRNPEKRDVCEECSWILRDQIAERDRIQMKRNSSRLVNAFASHDPFRELTGSIPPGNAPPLGPKPIW